jgi:RNA polymerase sigma factor (sigma-70 family)
MRAIEFEQIVHDHEHRLLGLARRMVRNRQDAEDIVQDALLRAYRALTAMGPEKRRALRLKSWLSTITVNTARNKMGKHHPILVSLDALPNPDRLLPQEVDFIAFTMELVEHALLEMPARMRSTARLRFIEDRSNPEIAEILDQPLGTVKSNLHRATHRMRRILAAQLAVA